MNKNRKKEMFARVDKEVWGRLQRMLPDESSSSISRILYNTSLLRLENGLRSFDKELSKKGRRKIEV